MKRSGHNPPAGSDESQHKKPKALQACANCRRSKVRCQSANDTEDSESVSWPRKIACRRCTSLGISCSFTESSRSSTSVGPEESVGSGSGSSDSIRHVTMSLAESIESVRNQEVPWGKLDKGDFDYSAAPIIALEIAIRQGHSDGTSSLGVGDLGDRLDDILSDGQRHDLLNLLVR